MSLGINPYIEFVDIKHINPCDMDKQIVEVAGDAITTIKWCRKNFGERGDGWDYYGGTQRGKKLQLVIWSSKLWTMYNLFLKD